MARVYATVNQEQPRAYWDYDSVNITWGVVENYEVVRKIGESRLVSSRLHSSLPLASGLFLLAPLVPWTHHRLTN